MEHLRRPFRHLIANSIDQLVARARQCQRESIGIDFSQHGCQGWVVEVNQMFEVDAWQGLGAGGWGLRYVALFGPRP